VVLQAAAAAAAWCCRRPRLLPQLRWFAGRAAV
jgi:hypothetical protein